MNNSETLLLNKSEVSSLLTLDECINSVEEAFKLYAEGKAMPPGVLGIHALQGGFHVKAGILNLGRNYFVAKINANFPDNRSRFGLPTIQGVLAVSDADNGRLLALMDSMEITIIRTGAATAIAAKYLSRKDSKIVTICGCGNQGRISLKMLMKVRNLEKVYAFDIDPAQAQKFAKELTQELNLSIDPVLDLRAAVYRSDICVTCTTSKKPLLHLIDIASGTFIAAVGADNEDKQELESSILSSSKLVTDLTSQCATIGELHHAISKGLMTKEKVHAELGEIISGKKEGRTTNDEIIVFDSTGTALQDVAAAAIVYEKAVASGREIKFNFAE